MDNNHLELVRGNLYAALINYLHLIASADTGLDVPENKAKLSLPLSTSLSKSSVGMSDNQSIITASQLAQKSGLEQIGSNSMGLLRF